MRRIVLGTFFVLLLGSSLAPSTTASAASTLAAPLPPTSVRAVQSGAGPDVEVTWTPSTLGTPASGAVVEIYAVVGGTSTFQTEITCGASCDSTTFRDLSFGTEYEGEVLPTNAQGQGSSLLSPPVTLTTSCQSGACVTIDTTAPLSPANHAASGMLASVFPAGNDASDLEALGATMFRGSPLPLGNGTFNWSSWNVAVAAGTQTSLVLSDVYSAANGGDPPTPWANWTAYNSEITTLVTQLAASGEQINYWEVYNEPGGDDDYYTAAGYASETPALLLQQFLDTYQDIRSVLPNAAIIGPSLEHWSDYPGQYGTEDHAFDMATFLNFAATNDLQLAAITWHEIDDTLGPTPEEDTIYPATIEDHVAEARRLIAALPALGDPQIFINEYGMPEVQTIPGWDVAYLAALTDAGVASADRACWGTACSQPDLDALIGDDGVSTSPTYFERLVYASMSGNMITTTSNSDTVNALGAFNATTGTLTALIGRGVGCAGDPNCASTGANGPSTTDAAPISTTITVTVPWSSGMANVALTDFEGQNYNPESAPAPYDVAQSIAPTGTGTGTVTLTVPSFADGDAYGLVLTHIVPGTYVSLTPARIADTRAGSGFPDAGQTLSAGGVLPVAVEGAGGVPSSGVSAVVLNVAATNVTAPGFITVYPEGAALPAVANLNTTAGATVSNLVTVGVGSGGGVSVYNHAGRADIVVDVAGYYTTTVGSTGLYDPVSPDRVFGTAAGGSPVAAGASQAITVTGGTTGVPSDATAVVCNLTASDGTAPSFLTAYPTGDPLPTAANLNFGAGQVVGNRITVAVGSGGRIEIYNHAGTANIDVDLDGYYTGSSTETGNVFVPLTAPARLVDTRSGLGGTPLGPTSTETFSLAGPAGIPSGAAALAGNITVVAGNSPGYLTVYPTTDTTRPLAADVNWAANGIVPNFTVIPLNNSAVDLFNSNGAAISVVIDAFGYFLTTG